tara:strand:+ start:16330 stop:16632 length:303 start_codon:yes stop_codon:yes gene_type:complete
MSRINVLWRFCHNDAVCGKWKEIPNVRTRQDLDKFIEHVPLQRAAWWGTELVLTDPTRRWQYMMPETSAVEETSTTAFEMGKQIMGKCLADFAKSLLCNP